MIPDNANIDTRAEAEKDAPEQRQSSKFWLGEIKAAKKREDSWSKKADKVVARYRDEREGDREDRRANVLWSNTELLKSALYQGLSPPDVRRKFPAKSQQKAAREVALLLERGLSHQQDYCGIDMVYQSAVEDCVLAGRGTIWVTYQVELDEQSDTIKSQSVKEHYVYWKDFKCSAGRTWNDVWWAARKHCYTRDELIKEFGEDDGKKIPTNLVVNGYDEKNDEPDTFKRAEVWEVWDKSRKQRVYVAEGYDYILKSDDDPYGLEEFFPCPQPLYGVRTTSSLVPIPEFLLYQDQALELDQVTTRLYYLVDNLKRRGVYDATMEGPDNQLSSLATAGDNEFIPYKGFAALMEKGGLRGVFQAEDLTQTIAVVQALYQQRASLMQTIYEVTGISDVLRGATNPNETATAQKIKGQFGSLRLVSRQNAVHQFVREAARIKAEIIAEHWTRERLSASAGIELPLAAEIDAAKQSLAQIEAAQQAGQPINAPVDQLTEFVKQTPWEEVEAIIRSDERRCYAVDVETDITAKMEAESEKTARIEFVTSMQAFLGQAIPAAMQMPEMIPLVKEMTMFGMRAFKIGRTMEETFDDAFDQIGKRAADAAKASAQQPQAPPVDPRAEAQAAKLKADAEATAADTQIKTARAQQDMQTAALDVQAKMAKANADQMSSEIDIGSKVETARIDREKRIAELKKQLLELERMQAQPLGLMQ